MPRVVRQEAEAVGSDSFLDVVTNIVGILIILVMVVGIRIMHAPAKPAESDWDEEQAKAGLAQLEKETNAIERDVHKIESQIADLAGAAQQHFAERGVLAYMIAEHARELATARKSLDEDKQQAFDLRRAHAKVERDLQRLGGEA